MQSVTEFRNHLLEFAKNATKFKKTIQFVDDVKISSLDRSFSGRFYNPKKRNGPQSLILYIHGAGFIGGDLDTHDNVCRYLSAEVGCAVLSIDYHRPPESVYPAAPEDCYAALCWAAKNAAQLGIDKSRIVIAGDSAGGNLTAVLGLIARDRNGPKVIFQLMVNPLLDMTNLQGYEWFRDSYLEGLSEKVNPYTSPVHAKDLSNLPDAFIITSENDALCPGGEKYVELLRAAGVFANSYRLKGLGHLGMEFAAATTVAQEALGLSVCVLHSVFNT
jgi:acetyl esterase